MADDLEFSDDTSIQQRICVAAACLGDVEQRIEAVAVIPGPLSLGSRSASIDGDRNGFVAN